MHRNIDDKIISIHNYFNVTFAFKIDWGFYKEISALDTRILKIVLLYFII